jgi:hypothetical protein
MDSHRPGETLIFDNFDIDLLVKVLENTLFSASLPRLIAIFMY